MLVGLKRRVAPPFFSPSTPPSETHATSPRFSPDAGQGCSGVFRVPPPQDAPIRDEVRSFISFLSGDSGIPLPIRSPTRPHGFGFAGISAPVDPPRILPPPIDRPHTALELLTGLIEATHALRLTTGLEYRDRFPQELNTILDQACRSLTPLHASQLLSDEIRFHTSKWMERCFRIREIYLEERVEQLIRELQRLRCVEPKAIWERACRWAESLTRIRVDALCLAQAFGRVPNCFWDPLPIPPRSQDPLDFPLDLSLPRGHSR